jgi:hypothetical protein
VIASDGIRTASAQTGLFRVAQKTPRAFHFFENDGGKSRTNLAHATYECGELAIVPAHGHDLEDGELTNFSWSITSPVSRTLMGRETTLSDLPPGEFTIAATATDSFSGPGSATLRLTVLPKHIAEASGSILLDGVGGDAEYAADRAPLEIRHPTGEAATGRMVHRDGRLSVCASGLLIGSNAFQWFGVAVAVKSSNRLFGSDAPALNPTIEIETRAAFGSGLPLPPRHR